MPVERKFICEIRQPPVTIQCLACFTSFSLTPEREQPFAVPSSQPQGLGARDELGTTGPPAVGPNLGCARAQGLWGAGDIPSPSSLCHHHPHCPIAILAVPSSSSLSHRHSRCPPSSLSHHHPHCPITILIVPSPSSLSHHHPHCPITILAVPITILIVLSSSLLSPSSSLLSPSPSSLSPAEPTASFERMLSLPV